MDTGVRSHQAPAQPQNPANIDEVSQTGHGSTGVDTSSIAKLPRYADNLSMEGAAGEARKRGNLPKSVSLEPSGPPNSVVIAGTAPKERKRPIFLPKTPDSTPGGRKASIASGPQTSPVVHHTQGVTDGLSIGSGEGGPVSEFERELDKLRLAGLLAITGPEKLRILEAHHADLRQELQDLASSHNWRVRLQDRLEQLGDENA